MSRTKRTRGPGGVAVAALLMASLAGCDDFLDVENPASLLDEDLERPELLETLAATPQANIAGSMSGLNSRSGLLADELLHPSTQLENVDAMQGNRLAANSGVEGHWRGLAQARWLADEVVDRLTAASGSSTDIASANFWGGIARISMADHFNVIVYDETDSPRGPIQVINDAIVRFEASALRRRGVMRTFRQPLWDRSPEDTVLFTSKRCTCGAIRTRASSRRPRPRLGPRSRRVAITT